MNFRGQSNGKCESTRDGNKRFQIYWSESWEEKTERIENSTEMIVEFSRIYEKLYQPILENSMNLN